MENVACFVNHKAQRSDAGVYRLTLRNREGYGTISLKVNVLGKRIYLKWTVSNSKLTGLFKDHPGKPTGPLEVSNLDAESCILSWKPPADNGGNDITNYIVEKKDVGTNKWIKVSPHCLENSCAVKGLEEGKEYEFRVTAENMHGESEPLLTTNPIVAKWPFNPPGTPGTPTCTDHTETR